MATSLLKTLAGKHQTSVRKEAKRLQGTAQTPAGPRTCLKLTIPREGKRPLVATFGGRSLKRVKHPVIKDQVITPYPRMRSEIIERLLHDICEVCGSKEHIEMHHIRKLADLNNPTASFNSLPNVLVHKSAVTARSWLTSGTLRWSWTPSPPSPQVMELLVVKLRFENNYLLQKLFL